MPLTKVETISSASVALQNSGFSLLPIVKEPIRKKEESFSSHSTFKTVYTIIYALIYKLLFKQHELKKVCILPFQEC